MAHFTETNLCWQNLDGRLKIPFNMIVSGPTGAGKSTLVGKILDPKRMMLNGNFKYILVFIGTTLRSNTMAQTLLKQYPKRCRVYPNTLSNSDKKHFLEFLSGEVEKAGTDGGLLIFDDLMREVTESGVLVPLFTKLCSHNDISTIFVTQNIFDKGAKNDASTVYRNAHYIAIFDCSLDNTTLEHVARKLSPSRFRPMAAFLAAVCSTYGYVFIDGRQQRNGENIMKFRTDLGGLTENGIPYQRIISPPDVIA